MAEGIAVHWTARKVDLGEPPTRYVEVPLRITEPCSVGDEVLDREGDNQIPPVVPEVELPRRADDSGRGNAN